eukprot:7318850-Pyramimonas_sp.AAC.1
MDVEARRILCCVDGYLAEDSPLLLGGAPSYPPPLLACPCCAEDRGGAAPRLLLPVGHDRCMPIPLQSDSADAAISVGFSLQHAGLFARATSGQI